ncbi:MAG: nickel-dependent hydrogenase large subunit [Elusimicrobiota bacterium]
MSELRRTVIPIGPYHPLQEEPEYFKLYVEGERVVDIDIEVGYLHRGVERLSEDKHYDQIAHLVERICGICSTSHPFAYINAVEDAAGFTSKLPGRVKLIRTIIAEMERVHSHFLWLGLAGHFLGYNTVWMWAWKYREPLLDMFELISGNRQHYSMFKVGGVRRDINKEDIPQLLKVLDEIQRANDMFKGAVMDDPVIQARTKKVCILTKENAEAYCVVGPTARASGVDIDVRRDDPYAAYDMLDWKVITQKEGDVFAKLVVRVLEVYESISIIKQALHKLDDFNDGIDMQVKEIPPGDGIGRHEAPRGEVIHFVRSDGTNRPVRHKIRAPSYVNIASNKIAVVGNTVSDAALALAAVDPCYCCTDRSIVIDVNTNKTIMTGKDLVRLSQEKTLELRKKLG